MVKCITIDNESTDGLQLREYRNTIIQLPTNHTVKI